MRNAVLQVVRSMGLNVHPHPSDRHLTLDYPVSATPRYGYGRPPHPALFRMIDARRSHYDAVLDGMAARADLLAGIGLDEDPAAPLKPHWNNGWFPPLDGAALMHFLLELKPRRFVEIGSGHSTRFARHAIEAGATGTTITSIDPEPRCGVDALCDTVVRSRLETLDRSVLDMVEPGDILFFDGSHRVFTDSDVTIFFLETLPHLPPGVNVQIHDIYLPDDYPPEWGDRYYSEQYMLALDLLHRQPEILLANAFISRDPALKTKAAALTAGSPLLGWVYGVSFWFRT